MPSAAESQHYVPKFILRNFLSNQKKDQVSVFQKSTGKIFHPNIKGIMTERRFNEFKIDEDFYASFESSVCRIEDLVFPIYGEMISSRIIRREPENIAHISMFIAFQMLRVRAYREGLQDVGRLVREKFSKKDLDLPWASIEDENQIKRNHIYSIRESLEEFSQVLAEKHFALMEAPDKKSFYLGDNPVVLHNDLSSNGWIKSNLALKAKGIQVYIPLTSKLMLAAWCPSILADIKKSIIVKKNEVAHLKAAGTLGAAGLKEGKYSELWDELRGIEKGIVVLEDFLHQSLSGAPIKLTSEHMDHYNSLQVLSASDFIICQRSDFDLAKEIVAEVGPKGGYQIKIRP
jgi:hypothetical protein